MAEKLFFTFCMGWALYVLALCATTIILGG